LIVLYPHIQAEPVFYVYKPVIIDINVVFPAPLGPNNPNISPYLMEKLREEMAV
jgi:hypothetical protein